jgi:hypothetical protein
MKRMLNALAASLMVAGGLWFSGCSHESTGHDQNLGGVLHRDGYRDPAGAGCPACHGKNLEGRTGPSCYSCHDSATPLM